MVKLDVGGRDPVSGESFALDRRPQPGMHKTQGFGVGGPPVNEGSRIEPFVLLAGEPATRDLLDGVDTTWNRVPGGAEIARLIDEAIASFNAQDAAASVPALLAIRRRLAALPADPRRERQARAARSASSRPASVSRSRPWWIAPRSCPARR